MRLLRALLARVVRKGRLEVETSGRRRFIVGDGTGGTLGIRLADNRAIRQLTPPPTAASDTDALARAR